MESGGWGGEEELMSGFVGFPVPVLVCGGEEREEVECRDEWLCVVCWMCGFFVMTYQYNVVVLITIGWMALC